MLLSTTAARKVQTWLARLAKKLVQQAHSQARYDRRRLLRRNPRGRQGRSNTSAMNSQLTSGGLRLTAERGPGRLNSLVDRERRTRHRSSLTLRQSALEVPLPSTASVPRALTTASSIELHMSIAMQRCATSVSRWRQVPKSEHAAAHLRVTECSSQLGCAVAGTKRPQAHQS